MGGKRRGDGDPERVVAKRGKAKAAAVGPDTQDVFNVNDYASGYESISHDKIMIDRELTHGQVFTLC